MEIAGSSNSYDLGCVRINVNMSAQTSKGCAPYVVGSSTRREPPPQNLITSSRSQLATWQDSTYSQLVCPVLLLTCTEVQVAGQLLTTVGDNPPQRMRSETAFAHLCGWLHSRLQR